MDVVAKNAREALELFKRHSAGWKTHNVKIRRLKKESRKDKLLPKGYFWYSVYLGEEKGGSTQAEIRRFKMKYGKK